MRQSADAAVLLVANLNIRGVGNGDVNAIRYKFSLLLEMICFTFSFAVSYGTTVSACREDACATFFTFAHELGHNFGATHGYHHHHHFLNCFNVLNVSRLRPDNQISLESNQCASCCQKCLHFEIFEAIHLHFNQTVLFFSPHCLMFPRTYMCLQCYIHPFSI